MTKLSSLFARNLVIKMDNADRQKITLNIDKLLQYTDYEELMEKCLQKELLFIEMKEQIEVNQANIFFFLKEYLNNLQLQLQIYPDEHTRHRKLLEKITHRGPKAFQKFTNILNLSFPDALSILETKYSGLDRSLHDRKFITANPNVPRPQATVMPVMVPSLPARPIGAPRNNITPHLNGAAALPNTVNPAAPVPHCSSCPPIDVGGGLKLEYYTKEINPKRRIRVRQSDRFHTQSGGKVSTYDMKSAKRGVLFLVNIINFKTKPTNTRNGASVDRDNLINLFRQMQFQIIYYEDITKAVRFCFAEYFDNNNGQEELNITKSYGFFIIYLQQFFSLLNTFVKSPFLRGVDCLVFGLLSHGDEHFGRTTVEFHDDMADINDIIEKFSNANCTRLIGKPKIFLFPFCR